MKVSHVCSKCGEVVRGTRCQGCGHGVLPEVPHPLGREEEGEKGVPKGPPKKGKRPAKFLK